MGDLPEHLKEGRCEYCLMDFDPTLFGSTFGDSADQHYKSFDCLCGKKNWVKMDFLGSGHDDVTKEDSELESMIRKVQER